MLLACLLLAPTTTRAAAWADRLFDELERDFGVVQRGSKPEYDFVLTNTGSGDVRIKRLRVSCACTRVSSSTDVIPTGASAAIHAVMDTAAFAGPKSVTIYVELDRPRRAQVTLRLACVSSTEPVAKTSELNFGLVAVGGPVVRKLNIDYVGDPTWRVVGLDFGNPHLRAEIGEVSRKEGKVRYELTVTLDGAAPAGLFADTIRIRANDAAAPRIHVAVKAQVEKGLVAAPSVLEFRDLAPGAIITRNVLVKAPEPFRVTRVDKSRGMFTVRSSPKPKRTQLVVLTLTVPDDPGALVDHLEFVTDLPGKPIVSVSVRTDRKPARE